MASADDGRSGKRKAVMDHDPRDSQPYDGTGIGFWLRMIMLTLFHVGIGWWITFIYSYAIAWEGDTPGLVTGRIGVSTVWYIGGIVLVPKVLLRRPHGYRTVMLIHSGILLGLGILYGPVLWDFIVFGDPDPGKWRYGAFAAGVIMLFELWRHQRVVRHKRP